MGDRVVTAEHSRAAGTSRPSRGETRTDRLLTPSVRGRRRPWLIALGALLASMGALGVVWMAGAAGQRQEVLVVRQELAYGDEVTAAVLGVSRVSVDPGVEVVPASGRSEVIGLTAATRLTPGMLLTQEALSAQSGPPAGKVLVPVALAAERMPAGGLQTGDRILAVPTQLPGAPVSIPAVVERVGDVDINGVGVIDVTTAAQDGPRLAVAAAEGAVAIVVQPRSR